MRIFYFLVWSILFHNAFGQEVESLGFTVKVFDFGEVQEVNGPVEYSFIFKNNNPAPVEILNVNTSCGCTTPGWTRGAIASGKTGFVKARFDPKGRPGFFSKTLSVTTNASTKPIVLTIRGNVVTENEKPDFGVTKGNLSFLKSSISFGTVFNNMDPKLLEFQVKNTGSQDIEFTRVASPDFLRVIPPTNLIAGATDVIKLYYDGRKRKTFGFYADNIELHTTDSDEPIKSFSVYASLEEYFAPAFREEIENAPILLFSWYSVELGNYKPNSVIEKKIVFRNNGKKDLIIKFIQPNCDCVTAKSETTIIKPGQESYVQVSMTYPGRSGTSQKAFTVYSNDPKNPVQQISLISVWDN